MQRLENAGLVVALGEVDKAVPDGAGEIVVVDRVLKRNHRLAALDVGAEHVAVLHEIMDLAPPRIREQLRDRLLDGIDGCDVLGIVGVPERAHAGQQRPRTTRAARGIRIAIFACLS